MEYYDVIIVGSGPAGISTALHLQQLAPELAARTLILEKACHPRPKPCGGGLTMDGVAVLRNLGLEVTKVPHARVRCACLEFEGRGVSTGAPEAAFYVFYREVLDDWLSRQARERGVTIVEESPVQRIIPSPEGVEVITPGKTYFARVVVGADGAHSVVRRAIGGTKRSDFLHMLVLWVPPSDSSRSPEVAYFDFSIIARGIPGYIWDFPSQVYDQPMRCWGIGEVGLFARTPRPHLRDLLVEEMQRHGYDLGNYRLYGEAAFPFSPRNDFSAPHILLVGDAIGLDVLYGEGMGPALGGGRIAAETIIEAFAKSDFSFRDYPRRFLGSKLGRALCRRVRMARNLYRTSPSIQRLIWWRLGDW